MFGWLLWCGVVPTCLAAPSRLLQGPVFATAVIAGVMAAKNTSNMIPFCHPLPIEKCNIDVRMDARSTSVRALCCALTFLHVLLLFWALVIGFRRFRLASTMLATW